MELRFKNSFLDQAPTRNLSDEELERIAAAYKLAKSNHRGHLPEYKVGNEWSPIYERYMSEFVEALQGADTTALRHELENFFRRPFSNGLHGLHFEMTERYMTQGREISTEDASAYAHTITADLDRLVRSVPHLDITKVNVPLAGNPYGYEIDGKFFHSLHFLYFSEKIRLLIDSDTARIVELGAGYGGMAWAIKHSIPQAQYIDFDLPEVLAIASFYALSCIPDVKVGLFGEVDVSDDQAIKNYDMLFMPNFEIENLKSDSADLSLNTWSLAEMEETAITNYVKHLCRISSRYFFHVNHTERCRMGSDFFPIDYDKYRLMHRAPSMWGKSALRNNWVNEHEFIYIAK